MVDLTDSEYELAVERGRFAAMSTPSARSVAFDRTRREIIILLTNGCTLSVPAKLIEDLADATDDQIADCSLLGAGTGLHWETLDLDLSVAGLLNGLFGTSRWMAGLGGKSTSPAKKAAARTNGTMGGRPRKKPAPQA